MDNFVNCSAFTLQAEGGYSDNPADAGNWTGGIVGAGMLHDTKCRTNAAAYPALDIRNLTQPQIEEIYRTDYFEPVQGDALPGLLALVAFDAAVNAGVRRSILWLQQSAGVTAEGVLGDKTLGVLKAGNAVVLAGEALARRLDFYARSPGWRSFGFGWGRRLLKLAQVIGQ